MFCMWATLCWFYWTDFFFFFFLFGRSSPCSLKKKKLLAVSPLVCRPYFIQAPWRMCAGGLHATHKVIYLQITFFFFLAGNLKCTCVYRRAVSKTQNMHSHLTWRGGKKSPVGIKSENGFPLKCMWDMRWDEVGTAHCHESAYSEKTVSKIDFERSEPL